jgi:crotonobetainyl-CoA:carnitine CoA-transferase CaiB-like acyl-CoA transferase
MGMQIADVASGSNNSVIGILAAVIHRKDTGKGQHVDISMTDGVMAFNAMTATTYLAGAEEPKRERELLNGGSLYDFYETKDGQYMSFGGLEAQFFATFCRIIGREDLIPHGIVPPNLEKVKKEIQEIFMQKTRYQWTKIFSQVDACVEPVLSLAEAIADENTRARGMVVEFALPSGEKLKQIANPIKFSATKQEYRALGCPAGTHTREVLLEIGYTEEQIRDYEKEGAFN